MADTLDGNLAARVAATLTVTRPPGAGQRETGYWTRAGASTMAVGDTGTRTISGISGRSVWHDLLVRLDPEALAGQVLTGVTSSWHEFNGKRSAKPLHLWLSLEDLGTLRLRTLNGLVITVDEIDASVDMEEYGLVVVERRLPAALSSRLGERIESVSRLAQQPPGATVGMVLHFPHHSVGIADLGDELVAAEWPSADWSSWGVSIEPGA